MKNTKENLQAEFLTVGVISRAKFGIVFAPKYDEDILRIYKNIWFILKLLIDVFIV